MLTLASPIKNILCTINLIVLFRIEIIFWLILEKYMTMRKLSVCLSVWLAGTCVCSQDGTVKLWDYKSGCRLQSCDLNEQQESDGQKVTLNSTQTQVY